MNIIIFITTYNRSDELKKTLEEITFDKEFFTQNNVEIEVWDDKSDNEHSMNNLKTCQSFGVSYLTTSSHFGKYNFWRLHKKIFKRLKEKNFDYAFSLQDDFQYVDNFLSKSINIFENIKQTDNKFVCLNLLDNRIGEKVSWTNFSIKRKNINDRNLNQVGWVDCVYLANKTFFEILDFKFLSIHRNRWLKKPKKSSGVGEQLSKRIIKSKHSIYQLINPFITHVGGNSQMGKSKL